MSQRARRSREGKGSWPGGLARKFLHGQEAECGNRRGNLGGESRGRERVPQAVQPSTSPGPSFSNFLLQTSNSWNCRHVTHTHLPHAHAFPPSLLWQTFQGTQLTPLGLAARSVGGMGSYLDLAKPEKAEQFEIYESPPGRREKPAPPNLQLGPTYPAQPLAI